MNKSSYFRIDPPKALYTKNLQNRRKVVKWNRNVEKKKKKKKGGKKDCLNKSIYDGVSSNGYPPRKTTELSTGLDLALNFSRIELLSRLSA